MALPLERVNTRKIALAARYGYAPNEVAEDGLDEVGITVTIAAYDREQAPSAHAEYSSDSPFVRVRWTTAEQAKEAREAQVGDYIEALERRGVVRDGNTLVGPDGQRIYLPEALL